MFFISRRCVCVCLCVYMCECDCICVCMRVCVSLSSSMENYPFVGLNALHVDKVCVCLCVYVCVCVCVCVCVYCVCVCVYMCVCVFSGDDYFFSLFLFLRPFFSPPLPLHHPLSLLLLLSLYPLF